MGSGKSRKTHSSRKGTRVNKQGVRKVFRARHIDQVWEDVRREGSEVHNGSVGPLGTTSRAELDEDVPAHGKFFCLPCSRYFISEAALSTHQATKPHKRRCQALQGAKPHNQMDADWAGGMGPPDNGPATMAAATMTMG
ncbi:hypothetical protein ACKKBG_A35560 [Auxenochlorella protothecoides x Auxenochlorella symbiontica]